MTLALAEMPIRRAVYARLHDAITSDGNTVPVVDFVGEEDGLPQIVLGDYEESGAPSKYEELAEAELEIEVWSAAHGSDEAATIATAVHEKLTESKLVLEDGWSAPIVWRDRYTNRRFANNEGEVLRIALVAMRFRVGK